MYHTDQYNPASDCKWTSWIDQSAITSTDNEVQQPRLVATAPRRTSGLTWRSGGAPTKSITMRRGIRGV